MLLVVPWRLSACSIMALAGTSLQQQGTASRGLAVPNLRRPLPAGEVLHASASAPSLGFDLSYSTDSDEDESCESPSPDIKAFHGESLSQPEQDLTSDSTAAQPADQPATQHSSNSTAERLQQPNTGQASTDSAPAAVDDAVQPFTARRSTDSNPRRSTDSTARQSFESASAVPISGLQRSRRPPLRANSTFANRDGMRNPRAAIKMVRSPHVHALQDSEPPL